MLAGFLSKGGCGRAESPFEDPGREWAPSRKKADLEVKADGRDAAVVEQAGGRVQRQPNALAGTNVGPRHDGDRVDPHLPGNTSRGHPLCCATHLIQMHSWTAAGVMESLLSSVLMATAET